MLDSTPSSPPTSSPARHIFSSSPLALSQSSELTEEEKSVVSEEQVRRYLILILVSNLRQVKQGLDLVYENLNEQPSIPLDMSFDTHGDHGHICLDLVRTDCNTLRHPNAGITVGPRERIEAEHHVGVRLIYPNTDSQLLTGSI